MPVLAVDDTDSSSVSLSSSTPTEQRRIGQRRVPMEHVQRRARHCGAAVAGTQLVVNGEPVAVIEKRSRQQQQQRQHRFWMTPTIFNGDDDDDKDQDDGDDIPAAEAVPLSLHALRARVADYLGYAPETVKLIHRGRLLRSDSDLERELDAVATHRDDGDSDTDAVLQLRALGSTAADVHAAASLRPDPLLRPFDDGDDDDNDDNAVRARMRRKFEARPAVSRRDASPFGFDEIRVLADEFPADHARARTLLEHLAAEPGVQHVMRTRRWRVGALCEMRPEGKVGVDPVCVLGYNANAGESIHLRLRTDDLRGFRRYDTVRRVLMHELAHNVYAEHNARFYELVSAITREADANDWRRTGGRRLGGGGGRPASMLRRTGQERRQWQLSSSSSPLSSTATTHCGGHALLRTPAGADDVGKDGLASRRSPSPVAVPADRARLPSPPCVLPVSSSSSSTSTTAATPGANGAETMLDADALHTAPEASPPPSSSSPAVSARGQRPYASNPCLLRGTAEERTSAMRAALEWLFDTQPRDVAALAARTLRVYIDNARSAVQAPHHRHDDGAGDAQRYRRIRMANAAFASRVGRFPAGVDVLRAAGFADEYRSEQREADATRAARAEPFLVLRRDDAVLLWLASAVLDEFIGALERAERRA